MDHVRRCVAVIVAALASGPDVGADSGASGTMASAGDYVEEVIVTADRLAKGAIPTQTIIVQTYSVRSRAMRLYDEQRYGEALPLLLLAAKRGFKWPQAMAGDILLHGRGEVDRDLESGIGWLGLLPHRIPSQRSTLTSGKFWPSSPNGNGSRRLRWFGATVTSGEARTGGSRVGAPLRSRGCRKSTACGCGGDCVARSWMRCRFAAHRTSTRPSSNLLGV